MKRILGFIPKKEQQFLAFLFLVFLIALGQQFYQLYFIFLKERFVDFYVYWEAARFALEGGDVYQKLFFDGTPFNYPPTALLFFSFLSLLPKPIASLVLLVISLCSLFATIFLLTKLQFKKSERLVFFLLASIFFIQFFPTKFTLTLGQINLVTLFLTVSSFYAFERKKDVLAGSLLSIASLIKIFPAFLSLVFLKERRKKAIFSFLIISFLVILLSALLFKPELFSQYLGRISKSLFLHAGNSSYFDQSLNSFLLRLNLDTDVRLLIRIVSSMIFIILFLRIKDISLAFFGFVTAATIFLSSFAWLHYYVVLIPLTILLFAKIYKKRLLWPKIALLIGYLACSLHIRSPQAWVGQNILLFSHPFLGAIILLFLALYEGRVKKIL